MPTTYGEGKESARRRLATEIEAAGSALSVILFLRNESFVGRESQLAELEAKLFSDDQTTTALAIVGPGGTGKSQLALEVAHRTKLKKKDCSVFSIAGGYFRRTASSRTSSQRGSLHCTANVSAQRGGHCISHKCCRTTCDKWNHVW